MIRRNLDVLEPKDNEKLIAYIVNKYSEENENSINSLLSYTLSKELVRGNISPEMYNWYVMALEHRNMLFKYNRKLLIKKPN